MSLAHFLHSLFHHQIEKSIEAAGEKMSHAQHERFIKEYGKEKWLRRKQTLIDIRGFIDNDIPIPHKLSIEFPIEVGRLCQEAGKPHLTAESVIKEYLEFKAIEKRKERRQMFLAIPITIIALLLRLAFVAFVVGIIGYVLYNIIKAEFFN